MYGVDGSFLRAFQSLYAKSEARVGVCREKDEGFNVKVRLCQGCVVSIILQYIYG